MGRSASMSRTSWWMVASMAIVFAAGAQPRSGIAAMMACSASMRSPRTIGTSTVSRVRLGRRKSTCGRSRKCSEGATQESDVGRLEGKVALVTGGTSGIGLATAKRFVSEGAHVFITGRRNTELAAAVKEIGKNVTAVQGDVSNLGDLDRLFAQIKRDKGKLDIVFANAGVAKYATFGEITEALYDQTFSINVKGLLFTVQKALPLLPDGAAIVLNSSIVGSKGLSVFTAPPRPQC